MKHFIYRYGKKRKKHLSTYRYYMCMADRFNISEANRILIIDMLNEPMLDDYDFIGIAEKSIRMRKLFGVDEETYMSAQLEVSAMAKIIGAIEAN